MVGGNLVELSGGRGVGNLPATAAAAADAQVLDPEGEDESKGMNRFAPYPNGQLRRASRGGQILYVALQMLILYSLPMLGCYDYEDNCDYKHESKGYEQATPVGISALEVVTNIPGSLEELVWEDGSTSELSVAVSYSNGSVTYVYDKDETTARGTCWDYLLVVVQLDITTSDGGLNEQVSTELNASDGEYVYSSSRIAAHDVQGTVGQQLVEDSELLIRIDFADGDTSGEIRNNWYTCTGEGLCQGSGVDLAMWG